MTRPPPRSTLFPYPTLSRSITRLPEYYPTRAERAVLEARAAEIAATSRAEVLVELGSGTSEKTRLRSEEHTSELQSRQYLVCRLLLEKKNMNQQSCRHRHRV